MAAGKIHIGTSGWSYKHWKEIFYGKGLPPSRYLEFYAGQFNSTEINASFYRLPKPETVVNWMAAVPKSFYFCPKMSRYVTHVKKLRDPELALPRFFDVFDPVKRHLGPILIQLPEAVAFHDEKAATFFKALRSMHKGYSFALEIRNPSWLEEVPIAMLRRYRIGLVIAESGKRWPYAEIITDRHVYLRFHGPDGSYASSYSHEVLRSYAKKCKAWAAAGHTVWAFFNNDVHGYAIENARTLIELTNDGH